MKVFKPFQKILSRRPVLYLLILVVSCTIRERTQDVPSSPYASAMGLIHEGMSVLKEGDLVLRDGQEFSSQLIKQFNRHDQTWSHAGIVFMDHGIPMVYHIVPEESGNDNTMKKDSLEKFCNPRKNAGFAIYRYDFSDSEIIAFKSYITQWYLQKVNFDSAFNFKTDDRMYCSEMIKKGLEKATKNRIMISTTRPTEAEAAFFSPHLKIPAATLSSLDIVSIDNLFLNPHCHLVRKFEFNTP